MQNLQLRPGVRIRTKIIQQIAFLQNFYTLIINFNMIHLFINIDFLLFSFHLLGFIFQNFK